MRLWRGYGLTEAAIACVLGMAPRTFRRKKHEARVLTALEKGKAKAEAAVGRSLFNRAMAGDLTAIIWWEKTRTGRSDRVTIRREDLPVLEIVELDRDAPQRTRPGCGIFISPLRTKGERQRHQA